MTRYNGIYNRQSSTINGYDWWVARNDVGDTNMGTNATIYFSTSHNRWVIEAPDVYWEANMTHRQSTPVAGDPTDGNDADDRRRFHGLSTYFGQNNWFQFSFNYPSGMVQVSIVCFDTRHPTVAPSTAPTTAAPTLAPTEVCTAQ